MKLLSFIILFSIILTATFGAGSFDVLFPDVIPLRPYTGVFQTAHSLTGSIDAVRLPIQIPALFLLVIVSVMLLFTVSLLFPHLSFSLLMSPLGARGSHSRANRRASGAGWKDTSQKQPLTAEEQFRILMQIFGKPRMVIVYGKEPEKKNGKPG